MTLIFLYGPPGVGKLTVAEALAERIGFKIMQNNPTVQAVTPIFEFGTREFSRMLHRIRLVMFEEAVRSGIAGLIFTFCYDSKTDDLRIKEILDFIEAADGRVLMVRLTCDPATLYDRIGNESRVRHGKLRTRERLDTMIARYEMWSSYPGRESLVLNTDALSPEQSAEAIIHELNLSL